MSARSNPLAISVLAVAVAVSGCSKKAAEVQPSYVSPARFQHLDCEQLRTEIVGVSTRVRQISGDQDDEAEKDAVAMGVGLVLFWPALFFLAGDDRAGELGYLKGDYEALKQVAAQKDCEVAAEIAEAKRLEAERVKKDRNRTYTAEEGPDGARTAQAEPAGAGDTASPGAGRDPCAHFIKGQSRTLRERMACE